METYSYATEPFEPSDALADQIYGELRARGLNVSGVRLFGDSVEVDVEPVEDQQLLLIEDIILAVLSLFGITVAGMYVSKFWPLIVMGIAVGGAVALAWIFQPPPGGEELLYGTGKLMGRAADVRIPEIKIRGRKPKTGIKPVTYKEKGLW